MKNIFFKSSLIVAMLVCGSMFAQEYANRQFTSGLFQVDEFIKRENKDINFKDTDSYTGTPYNHPSYLPGNVYKENEIWFSDVALRYNAVADEVEIKQSLTTSDDEAKVLTKSPDVFVKIADVIYVFVPFKGGIEGGGYFEVVYEGTKVSLFKKLQKDFRPEKKATTSITVDIPAKFSDEITYFLADRSGKFYEMPKSKNKKLKVFGKYKDDVKDFVKDNNIDLNEERGLMRAVKFYDSELK